MELRFDNPFTETGYWLKGNLHTHTTVSDGVRSPQNCVDHYAENGFDFLSITDHGSVVDPSGLNSRNMILIPGEELCLGRSRAGSTFHLVLLGLKQALPFKDFNHDENPQRAIDMVDNLGGLTILAHPYWSGLQHMDLLQLKGYFGVEIYNTSCEVYRGTGYSRSHIDGLLADGRNVKIFATDDHHGAPEPLKQSDSCGAWIMVKSKERDPKSILDSIKNGYFYASNGPEFKKISIEDGIIHVETSPVRHITFYSTPSLGSRFTAERGNLTSYSYHGREGEAYVRVEATDETGRTAWSNPIFVEKN